MSDITNFHNYLNNGRSGESILIKSTKLKSSNKKNVATNGKSFNKTYKKQLLSKNLKLEDSKREKTDLISWVVDALNPINHIPIINTLNKLDNDKKGSLDIVQSAIGGVIYGGGVGGIAKSLGGWFAGKLLPKNILTTDNKLEKDKNLIPIDNGRITKTDNNILKEVNYKKTDLSSITSNSNRINEINRNLEKNSSKIDFIHIKKNTSNYDPLNNINKISKAIDTKA